LQPLVAAGEIPVLGGFIASSVAGATTTLGRGGSDYTATLVGAALAAREVQLWTDVPGVLTADPRLVSAACTIPQLSYAEAAALASFGVKVLHAKTVQPLIRPRIPLRICNSHAPEQAGTLICAERKISAPIIKTIIHKSGAFKLTVNAANGFRRNGTRRTLADLLARYCPTVTAINVSANKMSVLLDDANLVNTLHAELDRLGPVVIEQQQAFVGLVGEGLSARTDMAAYVCQVLQGLMVAPITQRGRGVNLMFAVAGDCVANVVRRLHSTFFEG
jgi:aspartate kinase